MTLKMSSDAYTVYQMGNIPFYDEDILMSLITDDVLDKFISLYGGIPVLIPDAPLTLLEGIDIMPAEYIIGHSIQISYDSMVVQIDDEYDHMIIELMKEYDLFIGIHGMFVTWSDTGAIAPDPNNKLLCFCIMKRRRD